MPLYYDTSAPANGNANSITRTATDFGIRDFLLSLNIQNPIRYPQLSTSVNGSPRGGEPFLDTMVGTGAVPQQNPLEVDGVFRYDNAIIMNLYKNQDPNAPVFLDIENIQTTPIFPTPPPGNNQYPTTPNVFIEDYGLLAKSDFAEYRKQATIKNLYLDATKQIDVADYISLQPIQTAQQLPSYDEAFGQILGLGNAATQAVDIVGSILNGQGVGISAGGGNGIGLVPNFDIRSSLAGRVLGVTGILNDTKLGQIGAQQLALALANNAAFNTQQAILGKLNIQQNINAIFGSGEFEFPRPNYKITVSDDLLGRAVGTAERILGFTIPKSRLDDSGSIFFTESGLVSDTERANSMLTNTGKGQRKALRDQLKATLLGTSEYDNPSDSPFRNGYSAFYRAGGTRDFLVAGAADKARAYAFDGGKGEIYPFIKGVTDADPIPEISYNREKLVEDSGFSSPKVTTIDFLPTRTGVVPIVSESTDTYGNGVSHIITPTFSWASSSATGSTKPVNALPNVVGPSGDKKSLLGKTQKLFNSKGMRTIVSTKGDMTVLYGTQLETSVVNGGISKGSAVLKGFDRVTGNRTDMFSETGQVSNVNNEAENTFCRSWTTYDRYDRIYKLIRSRGLNQREGDGEQILTGGTKGWRLHNSERMSVLGRNGFPQIAPYKGDVLTRPANGSLPKKYMFSIENLAWVGSPAVNLLPIEQGPGDLLTGKFGRIMWFPPYDLTFSESSSVNLESNTFIGRGEPLYTYNNTERTGNLSFKIIVDHPSIANGFKNPNGPSDEYVRSWFAGCVDDDYFSTRLTEEEKEKLVTKSRDVVERKKVDLAPPPSFIRIYFPNDITDISYVVKTGYEDARCGDDKEKQLDNCGIGEYQGDPYPTEKGQPKDKWKKSPFQDRTPPGSTKQGYWPDRTNFGLNNKGKGKPFKENNFSTVGDKKFDTWNDQAYIDELRTYLKDKCPECKAEIYGSASSQGKTTTSSFHNQDLAQKRAESMLKWVLDNKIIEENRIKINSEKVVVKEGGTADIKYDENTATDSFGPKYHRAATLVFKNEGKDYVDVKKTIIEPDPNSVALNRQVAKRFYTELDFFEELKREDSFVFDKFREKIRYFHPAFHSTTPEGLNSRLTFLLQCTRQGPTLSNTEPQNLAFGAPPVCILRIGDFYNTKIFIDNLQIDYEPLVWDLNPEGVGVQPMIANVTISFKYIGGSSMYGPINKLQNALSFNYFANTEVYDPRADYIATVETIQKEKLIKNYPEDPKLRTRKTFGSRTLKDYPELNDETAYGLVPGLDSVNDSMGAFENQKPEYVGSTQNQVATSESASKEQTTKNTEAGDGTITECDKDRAAIYWYISANEKLKPVIFEDSAIYYGLAKNSPTDKIAQDYSVITIIVDKKTGKEYASGAETLTDADLTNQAFNITLRTTDFTPEVPAEIATTEYSKENLEVKIQLTGVKDSSCKITFNTRTGESTQELTPCDTDSHILKISSDGSSSTTYLRLFKNANNENSFLFYVYPESTNSDLQQDYKIKVNFINQRTKEKFVWNNNVVIPKTFTNNYNAGTYKYEIVLSKTQPAAQVNEESDDAYDLEFIFEGVSTACTLTTYVGAAVNSVQASEEAAKTLKVSALDYNPDNNPAYIADTKDGYISFDIKNDNPPKTSALLFYNIRSIIKSEDGSEQYSKIIKFEDNPTYKSLYPDAQPTDNYTYGVPNGTTTGFFYYFKDTTPVCNGLNPAKKYILETTLYNEEKDSQVNLNTLNITVKPTPVQTGPIIKFIGYIDIIQTVNGPYSFRVTVCQEGILKDENGTSTLLLSESEYKDFVDKNIKITLKNSTTKAVVFEKTVTYRPFDATGPDDFFNQQRLFGGGVNLGSETVASSDAPVISLPNGQYEVTISYQGLPLDTVPINIDGNQFTYSQSCQGQTNTTTSTTTPTSTANDGDVVNKIALTKAYKYDETIDELDLRFKWNKTNDIPSFVLNDVIQRYGVVKIITTENGQPSTLDLGNDKRVYVRRINNNTVAFGVGSTTSSEINLINTENGGTTWPENKEWTVSIEFDSNSDADAIEFIKKAQKDTNSKIEITWDSGNINTLSFYLDNTPAAPASTTQTTLQLPIAYRDEYESTNCDDAHAFGRQLGKNSNKSLTTKVVEIMEQIYNAGFNPKVISMEVTIGATIIGGVPRKYTTKYSVVVDKNDSGVAYTGFDTRGSCGQGYKQRADGQVLTGTENTNQQSPCYQKPITQCLVDEGIAVANSFDFPLIFEDDDLQFKQFFYQFAKPSKPPK